MNFLSRFLKKDKIIDRWENCLWDMHCHIIPGVDDGSESMEMSLEMIRMEIEQGVTDIMLTPHYFVDRTDIAVIMKRYEELKKEVEKKELPVQLYLGGELFNSVDLVKNLKEKKAPTLAGTSYILIEFMPSEPYHQIINSIKKLLYAGYIPIIAHVERYQDILNHIERVEELVNIGAFIQVNTNSFLKKNINSFLFKLMDYDLIHMIGTDSHSPEWRAPQMTDTVNVLMKKYPREKLASLFLFGERKLKL